MEALEPTSGAALDSSLAKPIISVGPWVVLAVLASGFFMIMLDSTIVIVAAPSISSNLNASLDQILWVLNAYVLAFAALLVTFGRLGDMFGPKMLFLSGLFLFTASSAGCGLCHTPNQLILFRVFQAIGGAALAPQTLSVITSLFPPEKRAAAFGLWGAVGGMAIAAGPILGGWLTSGVNWQAIFWLNVPIGIVAIVLSYLMMPSVTVHRKHRLDVVGVILAISALVLGDFALIEGQKYSWGRISNAGSFSIGSIHASLLSIPTLFTYSLILLVLFIVWERRQAEPLLPLSLFDDRNYTVGVLIAGLANFGCFALFLVYSYFLQSVVGLTPLQAGVAVLPNAAVLILVSPIAGELTSRLNGKLLTTLGFALFAVGLWVLTRTLSLTATGTSFIPAMVITGAAMGLTFASFVALAMRNIVPSASGAASGFMETVQQLGGAMGSAVTGAILASRLASDLHTQALHFQTQVPSQFRRQFVSGFSNVSASGLEIGRGQSGGASLPASVSPDVARQIQTAALTVFHHAFLNASRPALVPGLIICVFGAITALLMKTPPLRAAAPSEEEVAEGLQPIRVPFNMPRGVSDTIVVPAISSTSETVRGIHGSDRRPPYLTVQGESSAHQYFIQGTFRIGRLRSNDLAPQDQTVSRNHAQIESQGGRVVIRDLNSTSGTTINGVRVRGEHPLHNGDTLTLGDTVLVYHNEQEATRPRLVQTVDGRQREYPVDKVIRIGRIPNNDIVVPDPKVSRRHAEINVENGQAIVRDLDSLNGTRINGHLVPKEQPLRGHDILTVGDSSFEFFSDVGSPALNQPLAPI